jgi:hypothetical protein
MGTYLNFDNSELWEHILKKKNRNCGTCHSELWDPSGCQCGGSIKSLRTLTKTKVSLS